MRLPVKAGIYDVHEARRIVERAQTRYEIAQTETKRLHAECKCELEALTQAAQQAHDRQLARFVTSFQRLKDTQELSELQAGGSVGGYGFDEAPSAQMGQTANVVLAAVAGAGTGAALSAGTFYAVGALATAGTGTAISSLSGVAASNATLAVLGGGTLAAGGLGTAGGVAVLSGIAAIPALVIGSVVFDHRAKTALVKAKTLRSQVTAACAQMKATQAGYEAIASHARKRRQLIQAVSKALDAHLGWFEELVASNSSYASYDRADRERLAIASALAVTLSHVIAGPFITDGVLDEAAPKVLTEGRAAYRQLSAGTDGAST